MNKHITAVLLLALGLVGCGKANKTENPVFTELNPLLKENKSVCKADLLAIGNALIGKKKHRLQLIPSSLRAELSDSIAKDQSSNVKTHPHVDESNTIRLFGVLHYNDRPSHIRFDAFKNNDVCIVSYQLDYQLDVPCITAREEAFKKWIHMGKLDKDTQFYQHKRKPNNTAYLTNISRDLQCLVRVHAEHSKAIP